MSDFQRLNSPAGHLLSVCLCAGPDGGSLTAQWTEPDRDLERYAGQ